MDATGKNFLVTGGGGHLGRAIVGALLDRGARVAILDRAAAAEDHAGLPARCCDLTDMAAAEAAIAALHGELGGIDGLVNAAGLIANRPLINLMSPDERKHDMATWRTVLDANLTTVFTATACVVERMAMERRRGVVVTLSSVTAAGNAGQGAYAAAKAAVNSLTRSWAAELGPLGIRFVAVAPGFVDTASTHAALSEGVLKDWVRRTPLRRLGQAEQVAHAVLFAIENDYLTGCVLPVDGGVAPA